MSGELIADVNWIAVIVGAVAAYALGSIWYSPKMFGTKWMQGIGLTEAPKDLSKGAMVVQGIGTFLLAWVIGITETTGPIYFAGLIALTIAILIEANGMWAGKSRYAIRTEMLFIIAMVIIMIIAHAIF